MVPHVHNSSSLNNSLKLNTKLEAVYSIKTASVSVYIINMEVLGHSQNDNTSVVNAITNQDSKLDAIATNTSNIKASIEVGGDLYVSQDEVESLIGTTNTKLTNTNSKIDSMRGSHSLSDLNNSIGAVEGKVDTGNSSLASINGKITSCNTDSVIITSSALPTGASLESKQDSMITSLSAIQASVAETEGDTENVKSKLDNLNLKANDRNTKLESVKTKIDTTNTHQVDVKNKLDDGLTEDQIYEFLTEKYGEWILYDPQFNKNTYFLWFLPLLIFLLGGAIILKNLIKMILEKVFFAKEYIQHVNVI